MSGFRIHDAGQAQAVLRAARDLGVSVRLISPYSTPTFAGIGWWRALVAELRQDFPDVTFSAVLDCGPMPGQALAAIRAGVEALTLDDEMDAATAEKISGIAKQGGTRVDYGGAEILDLLGEPDPGGRVREKLGQGKLGKDPEDTEAGGIDRGER